jgi:Protein of unknown function (DUF3617)
MRHLFAAAALLALAGCSNPETEPPVDLAPGLYDVTLGGGTLIELKSKQRTDSICFAPENTFAFPSEPLSHILPQWDGCADEAQAPAGNAIRGARRCPDRKMPLNLEYAGSHSTDSFTIEGTVMQGSGEGGGVMQLGSGDFSISGRRVGDC